MGSWNPASRKVRETWGTGRLLGFAGLAMFAGVWQAGGMKKQASDQAFHDRRHQERKRAEAERKVPKKKVAAEKPSSESRVPGAES
jgi:hypothetical protein